MAIPQQTLDEIQEKTDIVGLVTSYIPLKKSGRNFRTTCPFHSEKTPSSFVSPTRQIFHCFGCGAGGDVFTLIMEKESLSFPEAQKFLADKYNIKLPEKRKYSPQLLKLEEQLFKISENALAFFKKNLHTTKEGEKALTYLKERKISGDVIQEIKIGYALNSWDSLLSFFKEKSIC